MKNLSAYDPSDWSFYLINLLAGAAMVLSFAPWHWHYCALFLMAGLYTQWQSLSPKKAWWAGYCFGLGLFLCGTWWIFIAVHSPIYGIQNILLAAIITLAFSLWLSCFPALAIWSLQKLAAQQSFFKSALLFPSLWVLSEWLRGYLLTGFPWMSLGYGQLNTPIENFAPLLGVYGVSFMLLSMSSMIGFAFISESKKCKAICLACVLCIAGTGAMLDHVKWTKKTHHRPFSVALLQMNISITDKWHLSNQARIVNDYESVSRKHFDSDIIVWPEGAIPAYLHQYQARLDQLEEEANQHNSALLAGIPIKLNHKSFNSIVGIGQASGIYKKRHLVPFGEYWPLLSLFEPATRLFNLNVSMYSPGPEKQPPIQMNDTPIAPFICYEITYPNLVRRALKDSQLLVTVTDDAWFGDSIAARLHLEIAQMRSLENGRYQLFSANTGISALIDHKGRIIQHIPLHQRAVLRGHVQAMQGHTPWQVWGYWPLGIGCFGVLCYAVFSRKRKI